MSISTTYSGQPKLDHKLRTLITPDIPPNSYTRTVCAGRPIQKSFRVESYSTHPLGDRQIPVQLVNTYEEYIGGCKDHEGQRCLGHFCVTPRGTVLLPQKMASTLGIMSNDYAKMAENVFNRDTPSQESEYRRRVRSLMLGKSGKMRGEMVGGPVDSSIREVISLDWNIGDQEMCIPRMVAQNMRVLRIQNDPETNLPMGHYTEDCVREGDYFIFLRPPSLWAGNVQPMRVVLWDHQCLGLNPSRADEFHADHDGDEMQGYFITEKDSIEQCNKCKPLNPCKFLEAIKNCKLPFDVKEMYSDKSGNIVDYHGLRSTFMVSSTLSIRELVDGVPLPPIAKVARMKDGMADMLVERLKNPEKTYRDFPMDSISGIKDVMAQQLNQGYIGDISRQARLSASCIRYKGNGIFHIMSSTETIRSPEPIISLQGVDNDIRYPLGGNGCMRAVTAFCSKVQQAMLDSHRVSREVSSTTTINLISNLLVGGDTSLIALKKGITGQDLPPHDWKYEGRDFVYCIVNNESAKSWGKSIVAAYNPIILKAIKLLRGDAKLVCRNGISMVAKYYDIELSELELYSITELLSYRSEVCDDPITTKSGLLKRDMRWLTVTFANHYGKLKGIQSRNRTAKFIKPEVITDAVAFCNFDFM